MQDLGKMDKPIIVMGMHRSGTSLVARILDDFGVFMGSQLDGNHETAYFRRLNKWVFGQLGSRWDLPPNMEYLFLNSEIYNLVKKYIEGCVTGLNFIRYLGLKNYILRQSGRSLSFNIWGWKDPRNVYTLPLWLEIFPNAKIIYVQRHGVDVANSLMKRSHHSIHSDLDNHKKKRWKYLVRSKKAGLLHSIRCCDLEGGFTLWEEYEKEAQKNLGKLDPTRILYFTYEELVNNTQSVLNNIIDFVEISSKSPEDLSFQIEPGRTFAYKRNPSLVEFADSVADRLMGYEIVKQEQKQ